MMIDLSSVEMDKLRVRWLVEDSKPDVRTYPYKYNPEAGIEQEQSRKVKIATGEREPQ